LSNLFTKDELEKLKSLNERYAKNIKELPDFLARSEFERLTIELSWKSSQIEGNTYSLLDTEALIKNKIYAKGHKKEEAIMILNHKEALDYILKDKKYFQKLTLSKITELHNILTKDLEVRSGFRNHMVRITGTKYLPLDNELQIRNAMENLIKLLNENSNSFEKALITNLMISYIHHLKTIIRELLESSQTLF